MAYAPSNPDVYRAAYAGALAGFGARAQPITSIDYMADMAGAFAVAVDDAWSGVADALDLNSLISAIGIIWSNRSPLTFPDSVTPGAYTSLAKAVIALVQTGTAYVVAAGVAPSPPIAPAPAPATGSFVVDAIELTPSTPAAQTLSALASDNILLRAAIKVTVPFDGAPTFRLGPSLEALLDQTEANLKAVGQYGSGAMIEVDNADLLTLAFNPGGSSVGQALLTVERMTT